MSNGYFPGKKKATRSGIITPRTAQETQIAAMPRVSREARQALRDTPPLSVGGADLVEGADRIMRTPAEHRAAGVEVKACSPAALVKVARIYMRVSTDAQDLARQEAIQKEAAMTRDEWIRRYVAAMKAGGSQFPDWHLIASAEQGCDATEQTGGTDPDFWEDPEVIADEDLESE